MEILRLDCDVQHYAWGDKEFIPSLLGIDNRDQRPYAELWMGAHPGLPSKARLGGANVPLNELISKAANEILGTEVAQRFSGQLPFLLKVLSAAKPLSIQVHPSPEMARTGFAKENDAGIPLTARERNYKDENHKPELIVALTDFYALRGFRPMNEIATTLESVPELGSNRQVQRDPRDLKSLYEHFMTLSQVDVDQILDALLERLIRENEEKSFGPEDREFWILKADREFSQGGKKDRGLFSIYLLNLIHLEPGEGLFLSAGILHAYLEGSGMEIMANSNNVLRGGLTPKHVDLPELLANVTFEGSPAEILRPVHSPQQGEWTYSTPAKEFELRRIEVSSSHPYRSNSNHDVEILILINSSKDTRADVETSGKTISLKQGQVCLIPHGASYTIQTNQHITLYKATVP